MTIPDPLPRSKKFVAYAEHGQFVLVCDDLEEDAWRVELRDHKGAIVPRLPCTSEDLSLIHLEVRDAHRLAGKLDLEPDFLLLSRRYHEDGRMNDAEDRRDVEMMWLFAALGRALQTPSSRGKALIKSLGEVAAEFLGREGAMSQLAHQSRRRRGKPTDQHWATLSKPVLKAMADLYTALEPALKDLLKVCREGTSVVEDGLRQRCSEPINHFTAEVVHWTTHLEGPSERPSPRNARLRALGVQGMRVAEAELAVVIVKNVARKLDSVSSAAFDASIQRAVSLDPADEESVKWVFRQVLGVLHGADVAHSRLRSFKFLPPT